MWVKICANTNLEDALAAAKLGADAVGFVFAPSKRRVTVAQVAAITRELPAGVERVGVFGAVAADEIAEAAGAAGLTAVQLHGGVDAALIERLAERLAAGMGRRVEIIQTVHWDVEAGEASADTVMRQIEGLATAGIAGRVLVDSRLGPAMGGTGVRFDWNAARRVFAAAPAGVRPIVAGGLSPENVGEAIVELKPWGVDVASGVEAVPGRKDLDRVERFIRAAKSSALSDPISTPGDPRVSIHP